MNMFFDMEEDVVRRRIRKARDVKSHIKNRIDSAMELVDLVERMLDSANDLAEEIDENVEVEDLGEPDPAAEDTVQGDGEEKAPGLIGKIFGS